MRLQIVGDRLLVRPNQLEKSRDVETPDGSKKLIIEYGEAATRYEAATTEGVVVQAGPLAYVEDTAPWCKVGDRISWGKYAGYWITDPETKDSYVILDPHDILCVINEGEAK